MFENFSLDNLRIRNKLIALLALPILALVAFAMSGYSQRNETASVADSDQKIVAGAAATSDLVDAMQQEMIATVRAMPETTQNGFPSQLQGQLKPVQQKTDRAYRAFTASMGAIAMSSKSDAAAKLPTAEAQFTTFTGYREQPQPDWLLQLSGYDSTITPFVDFVRSLSGLTSTPEVVLPLDQLSAILAYNLPTVELGVMASRTSSASPEAWTTSPSASSSTANLTPQQEVYNLAVKQDKANSNLINIAAGTAISGYFSKSSGLSKSTALSEVLGTTWGLQGPMVGQQASWTGPGYFEKPKTIVPVTDVQAYATSLDGVAKNVTGDVASQIDHQRSSAVRSATLYLFAGGLVIVAAIAAAIWISRSITGRLVKLTGAADRLSHEQLPRLVDSLKNPAEDDVGYLTSSFAEIEVTGSDEIGQLAGAFNRIQSVAVSVATEQAQLLRKGIGDMFVNLARRNQGLLDRQIEFIDQLESAEEDPDQLENLFRLDHLATRMRRNAESLLVLAGAEPSRRRGKPVPLADVVRAAVGEVEDFARVDMLQFDEVLVASNAALDIAHLLSELMENATNFSPPDTRVEVVGHRTKAEGYVISVTDHGIGIAPEALAEANDLLARPPLVGLALSRSLGYIVIGRLAARFGIAVRLMPSPSSGTTAMVSLPPSLITDQPRTPTEPAAINTRERTDIPPASEDPSALAEGTDRRPPARRRSPAATGPQALPTRGEGKATTGPSAMPRRTAVKAVPDSPTAAPTKTRTPAAKSEAPVAAGADSTTTEAGSAPSTDAGLTKRVPRRAGGQRAVPGGDGSRSATQNRRSPEEVRSMLSNYRSGMQKGRTDDSPTKPEDDRK